MPSLPRQAIWLRLLLAVGTIDGALQPPTSITAKSDAAQPLLAVHIERLLLDVLNDLPHLHVLLRADTAGQGDMASRYVRWFLRQTQCPLIIDVERPDRVTGGGVGRNATNSGSGIAGKRNSRASFVVVTSFGDFAATARRYAQRVGVFFYILMADQAGAEIASLRDTLHALWQEGGVFKSYLLTETPSQSVHIYDPFAFDDGRREYGRIRRYSELDELAQPTAAAEVSEYRLERALYRNMRGYPLRVQIFRSVYARPVFHPLTNKISGVRGVDGRAAYLLEKHMNFSMVLLDPNPNYFGERSANGTYNGAIRDIIDGAIDLCLNGFFIKDYRVPEMQFSIAVYDDQLCIYVPKAERIPQSILPLFSVRWDLWVGFILTAFVCAAVWCAIRALNVRLRVPSDLNRTAGYIGNLLALTRSLGRPLRRQWTRICIDTWVVWVRVNITKYPPFTSERLFVLSLCLVSVIFGALFESSLATVYIRPLYYRDIHTMRDLDESGLPIIYKYSSMADDLFFSDTSPLYASLNRKLTHWSNLNADVMAEVANRGGKASVTRHSTLVLELFEYIRSRRVWMVPECPKYYTLAYTMPSDAPWSEAVNQLLLRFLSAGLVGRWIGEMETDANIIMMKNHRRKVLAGMQGRSAPNDNDDADELGAEVEDQGAKVLTVGDLQLAFYVVLAGNVVAFGIFMGERLLRRRGACCLRRRPPHQFVWSD